MRRATRVFRGSAVDGRISIHALREESDLIIVPLSAMSGLFQSTLSVRRATQAAGEGFKEWIISIHALHEESDPVILPHKSETHLFQSTLSMRRATLVLSADSSTLMPFQSTLSMRRATMGDFITITQVYDFNPRSP